MVTCRRNGAVFGELSVTSATAEAARMKLQCKKGTE